MVGAREGEVKEAFYTTFKGYIALVRTSQSDQAINNKKFVV